ncbi:MAG TPA: DUF2605 domain-containing protein, partial [Candidatus Caenarcaniphilales bacterium]
NEFMLDANLPDSQLLKVLLQPLLEDFQYWFTSAQSRLEAGETLALEPQKQIDLLERVKQAQKEVSAAQALFHALEGQAGVNPATLMGWHQLVTECWQITLNAHMEDWPENKREV